MKERSSIKETVILSESKFFGDEELVDTNVLGLNLALSGDLEGGLGAGLTMFAGESRRFKTLYSLILVKAYMDAYPDAVCLYYDSEFGGTKSYFKSLDIDMNRVLHIPTVNIEQLKFDLMQKLDQQADGTIRRGDRVIIFIDSIGNLASKKEVQDAIDEKSVADMTRAKAIKSLWRIVMPYLTILNIPMVVVNHIYMEQGTMYPQAVITGGQGNTLNPNAIFVITRSQDKDGQELKGYYFNINVYKSRFVREKASIPILVSFERGVSKYSGLFDVAVKTGDIYSEKKGWYLPRLVDKETGEILPSTKSYRRAEMEGKDFWEDIMLSQTLFKENARAAYRLAEIKLLQDSVELELEDDDAELA